ncbi:MAG: hypothetical protein ACYDEO_03370 [Aggregatilineales bacterium]
MSEILGKLSRNQIIGLVMGILPFFLSFGSSSKSTLNGQVVSSSHFDFIAVGGGAIAILAALSDVFMRRAEINKDRWFILSITALILVLGIIQVLRGVGII